MSEPIESSQEKVKTELVESTAAIELVESSQAQSTIGKKRDPLVGTTIADRYELLSVLGRGATTSVYKARDTKLNSLVAVKILRTDSIFNEQLIRRFEQECHTLALLQHANIVKLLDSGVNDVDQPFLVMEYVEGISLKDLVESDSTIDIKRVLRIFVQICAALAAAHEKGVVHRDMKPANIMLTKDSRGEELVKLLDFGVAKILVQGETFQTKTQTGEMLGTLLYMSPEQCLEQVLDERCDVYSVGCVLFETLTGKPPLVGRTAFETMNKHLTEMPPKLSKVRPDRQFDARLDVVVAVAMAKDPKDRYQSIDDFQTALSAVLENFDGERPAFVSDPDLEQDLEAESSTERAELSPASPNLVVTEAVKTQAGSNVLLVIGMFAFTAIALLYYPMFWVLAALCLGKLVVNNSSSWYEPQSQSANNNSTSSALSSRLTAPASKRGTPVTVDDSSRAGTIYFLAMEASDGIPWKTIYQELIADYNIRESEVLEQKSRLLSAQKEAWQEVKTYVMDSFRDLDLDHDGFISVEELTIARSKLAMTRNYNAREFSLLTYLINNMDEIHAIVGSAVNNRTKGVRRTELSEYFLHLENSER